MFNLKFNCLDIILFSGFAYAISDCIKNWHEYSKCAEPLHIWLTTSIITLMVIRAFHFLG
jgi:hypothetical protein